MQLTPLNLFPFSRVKAKVTGLVEKVMVVLSCLAVIEMGCEAIVEEGEISVLVETIEYGSDKEKEFAALTLLKLRRKSARNRGLLFREGGIPPLVALTQTGTAKAKHKDKATVEMECMEEGYIAKILRGDGSSGIKVGVVGEVSQLYNTSCSSR